MRSARVACLGFSLLLAIACHKGAPGTSSGGAASVTIAPSIASLAVGDTVQFVARAFDSNGSELADSPITWSSSDESIATIRGGGLATMVGAGTVFISARVGAVASSLKLSVLQPSLTIAVAGTGTGRVISSPPGIDCSNAGSGAGSCTHSYPKGTLVLLTPTAAGGSTFKGWTSGDCAGVGTCTVAVDSNKSVTATFALPSILTVSLRGEGRGRVTSSPPGIDCASGTTSGCSFGFPPSTTSVTLTATTAAGSTFAFWSAEGLIRGQCVDLTCTVGLANTGTDVAAYLSLWHLHVPFPLPAAVARFGSKYIAAGPNVSATSDDGNAWVGRSMPGGAAIATSGTRVVIAGGSTIYSSADLETWSVADQPGARLIALAYGAGTFVAVNGPGGVPLYSTDGVTWNSANSSATHDVSAVAYGGGRFVAVGDRTSALVSPDGRSWTAVDIPYGILKAVTYGTAGFVAVGEDTQNGGVVLTSPDGSAWTQRPFLPIDIVTGVTAGPGIPAYLAVGYSYGYGSASAFASSDGASWTRTWQSNYEDESLRVALLGSDFFMASAASRLRSSDGASWALVSQSPDSSAGGAGPPALAYGNSTLVAVGPKSVIVTSPDGIRWTTRDGCATCGGNLRALTFDRGLFIAVGSAKDIKGYRIINSSSGASWTQVATGSSGDLYGVACGGSAQGCVAVGEVARAGLIVTSPDGTTWTERSGSGVAAGMRAVAFGNSLFAAVGAGAIYTSPDGASWMPQSSPTADFIGTIAFGNGTFVALTNPNGDAGPGVRPLTSIDGVHWALRDFALSDPHIPFNRSSIVFTGGVFRVGMAMSTDGVSWTVETSPGQPNMVIDGPAGLVGIAGESQIWTRF
jgi:hypothetical protein